ncbi:MAG: DNA repair exonuclease [Verrucomicrobia bacterium]|nr:DNA repair exonuclease [Verrucomicrobiota bacterium]
MKFVHAADIHLDSPLRGLERYEGAPVHDLRSATRKAFEKLVDLCLEEKTDFLLIAGDLYDGDWHDYNTGLFFSRQMSRLREAQIAVFLIRGNHDAESKITRQLRLPDNVHSFAAREAQTMRLEHLGVALHGRSFATQAMTENLSLSYPAPLEGLFNIGILHTSADGRPGHENYAPCSQNDLAAKGYSYWALGHIHRREVLSTGEPWIVFPGNLQGRHIRETGEKGCTLVSVNDNHETVIEHRVLDVVRWYECDLDVSGLNATDDLLARVQAALGRAVRNSGDRLLAVRLTLRGSCEAHRALATRPDEFIADVRALGNDLGQVWIERVDFNTRAPINLDAIAQQSDPLGQLVRFTRALTTDPARLRELAANFQDLRRKLPAELGERILSDEAAITGEMLGDVEQLLVLHLLAANEPP